MFIDASKFTIKMIRIIFSYCIGKKIKRFAFLIARSMINVITNYISLRQRSIRVIYNVKYKYSSTMHDVVNEVYEQLDGNA